MDKMQEEFKRWFYDNADLDCKFDSYNNAYVTASSRTTGDIIVNTSCCIAWQSWQASRAALCVELPSFENRSIRGYGGDCEEANMVVDAIAESLHCAGVPFK